MELIVLLATVVNACLLATILIGKYSIKAAIEKSIQHKFDAKIETIRSELHLKETEISVLRDGVLSGRANRQALLDKRRLEACDRVWVAVTALASFKYVPAFMASVKFDAAAEETARNPDLRLMFQTIGKPLPDKFPENLANTERPFVSPMVWALFSAYQAVLYTSHLQLKILESGIGNTSKYFNFDGVKNILRTALPHRADFIDKHDSAAYYQLLDELEEELLTELRKMLEGVETDEAGIAHSAAIIKAANKVAAKNASQIAINKEI